jgi:hypothetical protein
MHSNTFVNNGTRIIHRIPVEFETLRSENVTSQQLYLSFAPIDVVERYQDALLVGLLHVPLTSLPVFFHLIVL